MSGDAVVGDFGHVFGANLYLDGYAVHTKQRRVQRLVAVYLGYRDVVFEPAGNRLVEIVHDPQGTVAIVFLLHHDAEAEHVHDLFEGLVLSFHLVVDREHVFLTAVDNSRDTFTLQRRLNRFVDLVHQRFAIAAGGLDSLSDAFGAQWIECRKAKIL